MKRSNLLSGFFAVIVLSHWIITFFFYKRLPEKLIIPSGTEQTLLDNAVFFGFPILTTIFVIAILFLGRAKTIVPFAGKKFLKEIPIEHSAIVFDRAYQVVVMATMFISMILIYVQISIGLYSAGMSRQFDIGAVYTVLPIILVYLGFNQYILYRMARSARQGWQEGRGQQ